MEKETALALEPKMPVMPEKKNASTGGSNEAFLGSMLMFTLFLLLLGVVGFFSFLGYRVYQQNRTSRNTPSIDHLAVDKEIPLPGSGAAPSGSSDATAPSSSAPVATPTAPSSTAVNKATMDVKILNGGAAKGTAGTLSTALKKIGYTKLNVGNSYGDYVGTTIYYAKGHDAEAAVLKADILQTYPKTTSLEAPAGDKDASAAMFVIVLGK